MFLQLPESSVPLLLSDLLPLLRRFEIRLLRTPRLDDALLRHADRLPAGLGEGSGTLVAEWNRNIDACRLGMRLPRIAGVDWTACHWEINQEIRGPGNGVTGSSSCYMLPNMSFKLANILSIIADHIIACPSRQSRRRCWQGCVP